MTQGGPCCDRGELFCDRGGLCHDRGGLDHDSGGLYHDRESHVATGEGCLALGQRAAVPVPPIALCPPHRPLSPGTAPRDSSFLVNVLMVHHYRRGAWYPRGGASEIAFHAVRLIERAGGAVLVRAPVTRILVNPAGTAVGEHRPPPRGDTDGGDRGVVPRAPLTRPPTPRPPGVVVQKGPSEEEVEIFAPIVISDAGIFNTFGKLLPPPLRSHPGTASPLSPPIPAVPPHPCVPGVTSVPTAPAPIPLSPASPVRALRRDGGAGTGVSGRGITPCPPPQASAPAWPWCGTAWAPSWCSWGCGAARPSWPCPPPTSGSTPTTTWTPCKGPPRAPGAGGAEGGVRGCMALPPCRRMSRYAALSRDDVPENLAMMFITFPSAKDPTYEQRHPGMEGGGPCMSTPPPPPQLRSPDPLGFVGSAAP